MPQTQEELEQMVGLVTPSQQLDERGINPNNPQQVKPPAPPSFDDAEISAQTGKTSGPYPGESYTHFLKRTENVPKQNFDNDTTGSRESYLAQEHEFKKQMSTNLARAQGDVTGDPNRLFAEMTQGLDQASENYLPFIRDTYMEQLMKNPAAYEQVVQEREREKEAERLGLGPASQQVRNRLTENGQVQFDDLKDQETLRGIFPDQFKDIDRDIERGDKTFASSNERENAAAKSAAVDIIAQRLNAGLISEAQAGAALRALSEATSAQNKSTRTSGGEAIVTALGLPAELPTGRNRSGDILTDEVDLRTALDQSPAITRKQVEQQDIVEQRRNREQRAQDAADFKPRASTVTLNDGTQRDMIETSPGRFVQASGQGSASDSRQPGVYSHAAGWEVKGKDGKVRVYDRFNWSLGSDGKLYPITTQLNDKGEEISAPEFPAGVTPHRSFDTQPIADGARLGIPETTEGMSAEQVQALEWVQNNPNDPKVPQVLQRIRQQ